MAWNAWTAGQVLSASHVNENFSSITAILHSITGGQIAADAINAGTLIADDVVDENHLDWADTVNGVGALQIGKNRATYQQMMVKGATEVQPVAATVGTIAFTYSNTGYVDCISAGEPVFTGTPCVIATAVTDDAAYIVRVSTADSQSCVIIAGPSGGGNVTETQEIKVVVIGNI